MKLNREVKHHVYVKRQTNLYHVTKFPLYCFLCQILLFECHDSCAIFVLHVVLLQHYRCYSVRFFRVSSSSLFICSVKALSARFHQQCVSKLELLF